ncbi:type II CAAX prenyl endopeptidase Rce1 family protein [Parablastomonas sp. CN1-191]|uniref:CPBP family glutamic-type intramembrane protease n=1 Tax=Parablastomonas sp. CN1-191 TaxID=3400908 RepID=UPI003BF8D2BE
MPDAVRWPTLPGGWRLLPCDPRAALAAGALAIAGVTAWVLLVDADLCRDGLPLLARETAPLWPRTLISCLGAMREEVVYRLALTTVLAALPLLFGRRVPGWWIVAAILAAQFVNIEPIDIAYPVWGTLRFWLVGAVWGWLYWRHGFVTALAAHGVVHIVLDPLLRAALA